MTREAAILQYLAQASRPENLPYDTAGLRRALGLTADEVAAYQREREAALSMRPAEKRDALVRQVLKPLLKAQGFSTAGLDWRRRAPHVLLVIHMFHSQFNSIATGARFRFHICACSPDAAGKPAELWLTQQACELKQFDFLPYCGMLSPYYDGDMYKIDGYQNYLPLDTPLAALCEQIGDDFKSHILPPLCAVESREDFMALRERLLQRRQQKEVRLLRYYHAAQQYALTRLTAPADNALPLLRALRKQLALTAEDIAAHPDWMENCRAVTAFPAVDGRALALQAAADE